MRQKGLTSRGESLASFILSQNALSACEVTEKDASGEADTWTPANLEAS